MLIVDVILGHGATGWGRDEVKVFLKKILLGVEDLNEQCLDRFQELAVNLNFNSGGISLFVVFAGCRDVAGDKANVSYISSLFFAMDWVTLLTMAWW